MNKLIEKLEISKDKDVKIDIIELRKEIDDSQYSEEILKAINNFLNGEKYNFLMECTYNLYSEYKCTLGSHCLAFVQIVDGKIMFDTRSGAETPRAKTDVYRCINSIAKDICANYECKEKLKKEEIKEEIDVNCLVKKAKRIFS